MIRDGKPKRYVIGRLLACCGTTSCIVATDFDGWIDAIPVDCLIERVWNGESFLVASCRGEDQRLRVVSDGDSVTLAFDSEKMLGRAIHDLPALVMTMDDKIKHFRPLSAPEDIPPPENVRQFRSRAWSPQNEFS